MRLAAPLGLGALALAGPLVLWYVLRSRRPRVEVASTLLWDAVAPSVSAAVPWQRFRADRTFWLVLGALLVGALALARPAFVVAAELGDHTIIVVDTSASMQADEDGPTRLELARRAAADVVADLAQPRTASVIEAGATARVVGNQMGDAPAVERALAQVRPTQSVADLADAFTLAAALSRPDQDTVVHLFTDGAVPDEILAAAPAGLRVTAVGSDRPNLAVTGLEALATGGGSAQAFVQVRNLGLVAAEGTLTLAVDGVAITERALELPARGTEDLILPLTIGTGDGIVEAAVAPRGADPFGDQATDALTLDDRAFATLGGTRTLRVLVAGPGNVFIEEALSAVEGVQLRTAAAVPERMDAVDLLVVDRVAAPPAPTVPTLLVAPSRLPNGLEAAAPVELPSVTFQSPDHPLMADLDLAGVAIAEAAPVTAPTLEPVVASPGGPLVLAGQLDGVPVVHVAFDLLASNLPLQVAWPVLVANTLTWLAAPPAAAPLAVGDEVAFTVPPGVAAVRVLPPMGAQPRLLERARPRTAVDRTGVWRAEWVAASDADEAEVARLAPPAAVPVNLPAGESDLARPRQDRAGDEAGAAPASAGASGAARSGERILGRELLAGVLVLLLAEWVWSNRAPRRRPRAGRRGTRPVRAA
ncbi:MAG: VWA domain-containing protein [Egibacteraceae bacterium]